MQPQRERTRHCGRLQLQELLPKCPHSLVAQTEAGQGSVCLTAWTHLHVLAHLTDVSPLQETQTLPGKLPQLVRSGSVSTQIPLFPRNAPTDPEVCVFSGFHARKARPPRSYLQHSLPVAPEGTGAVQEGWQLGDLCLEQGHLQEPAGKEDKHSLGTAAPKNKASRDLLPWKSQLLAQVGSASLPIKAVMAHFGTSATSPHPVTTSAKVLTQQEGIHTV